MQIEDIIKKPLVLTEKGNTLREQENTYLFEVDLRANKAEIRNAVESLFNVHVDNVRTLIMRGQMRRMGRGYAKTRNWKKAMVTLKPGQQIEMFEGA
ncbi:MAG: 50S ribosomal protein L23 [Myxococcales bacterium]|nr:MAG: 50S ribosomal protein L23 [Myxococcales bacterium]